MNKMQEKKESEAINSFYYMYILNSHRKVFKSVRKHYNTHN